MLRILRVAALLVLCPPCGGCFLFHPTYRAPAPPMPSDSSTPPAAASTVQMVAAAATAQLQHALDSVVPGGVEVPRYNLSINGGADHCPNGISAGYYIRRTPLEIEPAGDGRLAVVTTVDYGVAGRARPKLLVVCGPLFGVQCGYDRDGPRKARLRLYAKAEVDDSWALQLHAGGAEAQPINRCLVSILRIDITERMLETARAFLNGQTAALDGRAAQDGHLRTAMARAWRAAWTPLPVGHDGWLVISPESAGLSALSVGNDSLRLTARLVARPVLTFGARPGPSATELPPNSGVGEDDSMRIELPIHADYSVLRDELRSAFRLGRGGIRYPATGHFHLKPTDVAVSGAGTQLVVRVQFKGSAKGVLYLTGTPVYDTVASVITVPDLDYTLETRNLLLKVAKWVAGDQLRDDLRAKIRIELAEPVTAARARLLSAMNGEHGPLLLHGAISHLALRSLRVDPSNRRVEALVLFTGQLSAALANGAPGQ